MNTGAVIFAFDNENIDYRSIAAWNAARIKQWLDIPVTLITDQPTQHDIFDDVIMISNAGGQRRWFQETSQHLSWHNQHSCQAFALSPYDRTLMLDADYVISTGFLREIMDHGPELAYYTRFHDLTTGKDLDDLSRFGSHHMPMCWATVLIFSRCDFVRAVFECWQMVHDNWQHYIDLYGIHDHLYRNDYALSIAINTADGHMLYRHAIPASMANVLPTVDLQYQPQNDCFEIRYPDVTGKHRWQRLQHQDFHAMNKKSLEAIVRCAS